MGCFSSTGTGLLTQVLVKMDQKTYKNIFIHHEIPTLKNKRTRYLQKDNDSKHAAVSVKSYSLGKHWPAKVFNWPLQSPDLNPIESLWSIKFRTVRNESSSIKNKVDVLTQLKYTGAQFDPSCVEKSSTLFAGTM